MTSGSPIAFDASVPLQHQVYLQLRHEIEDGLWLDRDDFPGERELAAGYGVSVITTRAALDRLADEGWVERRRGRGTRAIRRPSPRALRSMPPLVPVGGTPRRARYQYELLDAETRIAPADACEAFGEPPGTELWQCNRLRRYEGRPHSVTHNAQRPEIGVRHRASALAQKPMAVLLAAQGIELRHMRRRFHATVAPPFVARHLDLTVVDPVLVATFTMHGSDELTVEWVRIYLHPDRSTPEEMMDFELGRWSATDRL